MQTRRYTRLPGMTLAVMLMLLAGQLRSVAQDAKHHAHDGNAGIGRELFVEGFPDVGGNGRTCATCHVPDQAFQLTPQNAEARYQALQHRLTSCGLRQKSIVDTRCTQPTVQ